MPYTSPGLANLSLRGLSIDELKELAREFLHENDSVIDAYAKADLVARLSETASDNRALSGTLRKKSMSIKPSFFLMRISEEKQIDEKAARTNARRYLAKKNAGLRNLQVQSFEEYEKRAFQLVLTWESDLTYWSPEVELQRVRQLEFGFAIVDFRASKAILACHTTHQRDDLARLLQAAFSIKLTSIVLTKPLLEQIGTYDKVKRASYEIVAPDATTPENIVYADDNLGARKLAVEEENSSRSKRSQSFYRISILNPLIEEGLGATSESGKLWLPKETPIDLVRDYGTALLAKISGTIQKMARDDRIEEVLSTYRFDELAEISSADPMKLRYALAELIRTVIVMLGNQEEERAYILPSEIALYGVPHFFWYPMLRLVDDQTGEVVFWSDSLKRSNLVCLSGRPDDLQLKSFPAKATLDPLSLVHPLTDRKVEIDDVLGSLQLIPTEKLLRITFDAINRVSESLPKLREVKGVLFWITGRTLKIDLRRAFGTAPPPTLVQPHEFAECELVFRKQVVSSSRRKSINEKLVQLGEKCTSMSDDNCSTCLQDRKWLCLRSLVGRHFRDVKILAHKGIELSDMTARGSMNGREKRVWGFAKLPSGKSNKGLTLRNAPGAILMSQICGQLDKTTFDTVLVFTPATVNQDFQERLEVLCTVFQKQVCFLTLDDLGRMLLDFEEQSQFDQLDIERIYADSRKRRRPTRNKGVVQTPAA